MERKDGRPRSTGKLNHAIALRTEAIVQFLGCVVLDLRRVVRFHLPRLLANPSTLAGRS
jgi:hypothetical protein